MSKQADLSVTGKWKSQLENEISVKGHEPFTVDEPKSMGGSDAGPNPMEYFLGALSGCISITANKVAQEHGFQYRDMTISIKGSLDPNGHLGLEDVQSYFHTVTVDVDIETAEESEAVTLLRKTVEKRCPLYALLKDAGVTVHTNWTMKMAQAT